jgi:hypothetical protein
MSTVHKIAPTNPRIQSLLSEVENGNIKIPVFQRGFVWSDEAILSLLDSIYRGYPVGSILLWSSKHKLNSTRNVGGFILPDTPEDYPVKYVLDGQQRLTTLYAVFHSDDKAIDPDLAKRFDISFVPDSEQFVPTINADSEKSINMRDLLDAPRLLRHLSRFDEDNQSKIAVLQERIKDYEFPVITIKERSNREVCQIFQRINSSGTPLSTLELLTAWTWSEHFDLRNRIEELQAAISTKGFEDLDDRHIMRCLSSIVNGNIDSDALVDSDPSVLVKGMEQVEQAMYAAIDFVAAEFGIRNVVFLPFPIMIVPLVRFFSVQRNPTAHQRKQLRRWFWHCSFTQRYIAGTNQAVNDDIGLLYGLAKYPDSFSLSTPVIDSSMFKKTWRINSTAAKASICLLAQFRPISFLSGSPIDLDSALESYNSREFHHIFPKGYLKAKGVSFHRANIIANICMLNSIDNKKISDRAPSDYIMDIPSDIRSDVLSRALIREDDFNVGISYDEFIDIRVEVLSRRASQLMNDGALS